MTFEEYEAECRAALARSILSDDLASLSDEAFIPADEFCPDCGHLLECCVCETV